MRQPNTRDARAHTQTNKQEKVHTTAENVSSEGWPVIKEGLVERDESSATPAGKLPGKGS